MAYKRALTMEKQVDKDHYDFDSYYKKPRWTSLWYQVREVMEFRPESVIEVGGGLGLLKATLGCYGVSVQVVDIAEDLNPDILGSVTELPLEDETFDVACAFQVLEHLPFDQCVLALSELKRVARKGVVLSVPNARQMYCSQIRIPAFGIFNLWIPRPFFKPGALPVGGEHRWEIGRGGIMVDTLIGEAKNLGYTLEKQFRVPENPYHHFFVLSL